MKKITFYQSPLQRHKLLNKLKGSPSLYRVFKKNIDITQEIDQDRKERLNGVISNFYTCFIKGEQGSLKTSVSIEWAMKDDHTFNRERISFEYEDFRKKYAESQNKTIYTIDEELFKRGTGSQRILEEIQEIIETSRKRQTSLIICSPEHKYFPENLFTYRLETIDNAIIATCPENLEPHEPRLCKCWYNNTCQVKEAYVRLALKHEDKYLGFYIQPITWGNQVHTEYEAYKNQFMEGLKRGERKRTDYEGIAEEILKDPLSHDYTNTKSLKILVEKKKPNLTIAENELVCEAIKIIRKQNGWVK